MISKSPINHGDTKGEINCDELDGNFNVRTPLITKLKSNFKRLRDLTPSISEDKPIN